MMVTPPLMTLTQEAQSELDRYLRRVKVALRTHPSVDADEVERDVRGHIEAELAESPKPITEDRLRRVLDRLGSPNQWVPTDELAIWRRLLISLRSGPEDWRLAYVTFALFVAGPVVGPVGPLFFFASIPMARATLALLEEEGEPVGARRWLVYPPLLVIYVAIVTAAFLALPGLVATAADPSVRTETRAWFPEPFWLSLPLVVGFVAGIWWTMLGLVLARITRAVQLLFWPFATWFERRHGVRIAVVGLGIAAVAASGLAAVIWSS
jgi:HAAS domain-containing protein